MDPSHTEQPGPSLLEKVQTYTIVTIIAVLIWLYSESENVKQREPLQYSVRFVAPPGQQLLIDPVLKRQVSVTVRCATSQFAGLQRMQVRPIEVLVTADPDSPEQTVVLRDKFLDSPIGDLGVSIVEIHPRTLDLRVERIEDTVIPIAMDSVVPDEIQLAAAPVVNPTEAVVQLPVSVVSGLGSLKLEARVGPETLSRLEENVPHELTVPITLPDILRNRLRGYAPTIVPTNAAVTITVRKQTDTLSLTGVPILLTVPWEEMKRFTVELAGGQRVLNDNVRLSGPSDVIDKIRKGEIKVWADLRLTVDELESKVTSKPLLISVPASVRVDSAIPRANFTITPAQSPTPPPTLQ